MPGIDVVNQAIFVGAALVLAGIFSSLVATRYGAPLLLVFLVLGMLAGQDGIGGIVFNDFQLTYLVGSVALAVILFDGGLRTRLSTFRGVLAPALLLATLGVVITAVITGLAAHLVLGLDPMAAFLLGAIVASTDAAAVFFLLRTGGLRLQSRVGSTLEIESGTNDPIAVFLVIALTEYILARGDAGPAMLAWRLAEQGVLGAILGLAGGFAAVSFLNRVQMPGGLHPLFVVACAVLIYAVTALAGGSGLLAVYLAGLVMGNQPTRAFPTIIGFHDAVTWLCQIVMFLLLGLLVTPSMLWTYALPGVVVAIVLTFIARPVAVILCLAPFGYNRAEFGFISWVGLRGAVSIFLAAIPMLTQVPNAETFFNVAFFVVLFSLLVQGASLTGVARRLGVALRQTTPKTVRVEIDVPGQVEQEIVGYPITPDTVILGLSRLPSWAKLIMVVRDRQILDPLEAGPMQPGDFTYFLVPRDRLPRLDSLFRESADVARRMGLFFGEMPLRGDAPLRDVERFYNLDFKAADAPEGTTIGAWTAARLGPKLALGASVSIDGARVIVRKLEQDRIAALGLQLDALARDEDDLAVLERLARRTPIPGLRRRLRRLLSREEARRAEPAPPDAPWPTTPARSGGLPPRPADSLPAGEAETAPRPARSGRATAAAAPPRDRAAGADPSAAGPTGRPASPDAPRTDGAAPAESGAKGTGAEGPGADRTGSGVAGADAAGHGAFARDSGR